jgi:hypothetical protein
VALVSAHSAAGFTARRDLDVVPRQADAPLWRFLSALARSVRPG